MTVGCGSSCEIPRVEILRLAELKCLLGEPWPELLQVLFVASQSPEAGQREGAFRIFTTTPGIIEKQHENTVLAVFTKGLKDDDVLVGY